MAELLLVEAAHRGSDTPADQLSQWATELHDRLDSGRGPTAADRQLLTSWLRVQAIGRTTVTVSEARVGGYAGLWAGAAQAAGLTTQLITAAGEARQPVPDGIADDSADDRAVTTAATVDDRWQPRIKSWLLDRADAAGRVAIRAIQR